MGPGVMGQLVGMMETDPETALDCQRCHSPLSEQQPRVRREPAGTATSSRRTASPFARQGVQCAGTATCPTAATFHDPEMVRRGVTIDVGTSAGETGSRRP